MVKQYIHEKFVTKTRSRGYRVVLGLCIFTFLILGYLFVVKETSAVQWWPDGGNAWKQRKQLTVTNNSSANLSSGSTVAINIDTASLVSAGKLQSDCDDLRILYQPNSSTTTEVTRHLVFSSGTTCSTSTATKIFFKLQATLNTTISTTDYFAYYNNSGASTPTSTDDAFDTTSSINASLVCPFDGTTTCAGTETPSTESGAVRYSGAKNALAFDGFDDLVSITAHNSYDLLNKSAYTIEAWVYPRTDGESDTGRIYQKGNTFFNVQNESASTVKLRADVDFSTTDASAITSTTLSTNAWHHVVAILNTDKTIDIYIDGSNATLSTDTTGVGSLTDDSGSTGYIGSNNGANTFDGYIDEFRISTLARYTSNFTTSTAPIVRDSQGVVLYHFDENGDDPRNTSKIIDDSGNGNHGTITGAKHISGLTGVDNGTSDTGNTTRNSYAAHEGVFIEEGTTNKITNPSFDHSTYDTNWHKIIGSATAYWKLGEASGSRADSIGSNTLTDNNTVTQATGKVGDAGLFTRANSEYLSITDNTALSAGDIDMSIGVWVYLNTESAIQVFVGKQSASNAEYAVYYDNSDDRFKFVVRDTANTTHTIVTASNFGAVSTSTWYYIVAWHDSSANTVNIQVNNGTANSSSTTGGVRDSTNQFRLGASTDGQYADARIDEVGFWKRLLTTNEKTALYNAGSGLDPTNLTATENSTLPYYKFGSKSAKLVAGSNGSADFIIDINPASTATHMYSFYAYDGTSGNIGGTVSSSIIKPLFEGTAQSGGTYTDVGGGWWRVTYSAATTSSSNTYGFQVPTGKTVYVDGVQLEALAYATTYTDGTLGTGYSWSGTAHNSTSSRTAVSIKYATSSNIAAAAGSFSAWIKTSWAGNDSVAHTIFDTDTSAGTLKLSKNSSNNIVLDDGTHTATKAVSWSAGQWQHVVGTWTSGTIQVYVNGTAGTSSTLTAPTLSTSLYLGQDKTNANLLNGSMSDIRIMDTALSSTQVTDLYQSGLVGHSEGTEIIRAGGLENKGDTPVAKWLMDEGYGTTTYDSTTNANNLTVTGPTWNTDGTSPSNPRRMSLKFDGSNDYATRTPDGDFDFGTGSFTLSGWFKHPSTIADTDTILSRYGTAGYKIYMNSSGYICFAIDDDSTWTPDDSTCSTVSYADSKWHYFSAVKTSTTSITLYIDGNQVAQDASIAATSTLNTGSPLYLGIDSDGTSNPWDGFLDDFIFYNYSRTVPQIYTDLAGGQKSVIFGNSSRDALSDGLVGHWKLDESSGDASDSSGNAYTLTNNGTTTFVAGKYNNGSEHVPASSQYFSTASTLTGLKTISFWVNPDSTTNYYASLTTGAYVTSSSGTISATGFTSPIIYVNGVVSSTINADTWQHVVVTTDTAIDANQFYVGRQSTSYFDGTLDEVRVYTKSLSPAEVQQLYNFAPGPVAYWMLDEKTGATAVDSSGNGNTTSTFTGNTTWGSGKFGSGLSFDGTDDVGRIVESTSTDLGATTDSYTLSGWIKTIANYSGNATILAKDDGSGAYPMSLYLNSSEYACFQISDGTNSPSTCGSTALNDGLWHHISGVRDVFNDKIYVYVDGLLINSTTDTTTATTVNNDDLSIGSSGTSYIGNDFDGAIDDVRIYSYARTSAQIVSDMNGGHPLGGSPVGSQVIYWKLDEGYGSLANDSSASGSYDGTITNSTWSNSGKFGKALTTGSSLKSISAGDVAFVDGLAEMSVSIWVNPTTLATTKNLIGKYNGFSQDSFALFTDSTSSDELRFYVPPALNTGGATSYFLTSDANLVTNSWQHIVLVYNGTLASAQRAKVYINGRQTNGAITGTIPTAMTSGSTTSLKVGDVVGNNTGLSATYDEVKIYNSALSLSEILIDYNRGSSVILGALSNSSTYQKDAANQEYCVPGDTTSCSAPIGEWKMDEASWTNDCSTDTVFDSSGNGNHGDSCPNTTGPTGGTIPGKIGKAGTLDGTDEYVDLYDSMNASLGTTYTVSAWIKTTTVAEVNVVVSYRSTSQSTPVHFQMDHNNADVRFIVRDTAGNIATASYASALTADSWYHITGVRNGNTTRVYVNGIEGTSATASIGNTSHDKAIIGGIVTGIGSTPNASTLFKGAIDNLRIYNYVRTPAQISWEYNRGAPLAHYKLDECTSTTANDMSGNSYTGTITIGATGSNTSTGTCSSGTSTEAWNNGTSGKWNSSLDLDGTDDYIQISDSAPLRFDASNINFSLFAWVKRTTTGTEYIISKEDADNDGYRLQFNSSDQVLCSVDATDVTSTSTITDTNWHLVGCTIDRDGNGQIYIDGKANGSTVSMGTDAMATTSAIRIGTRSYTSTSYLNGQIDDVRIYNYALTASQVRNLFNEGASVRFGPASGNP